MLILVLILMLPLINSRPPPVIPLSSCRLLWYHTDYICIGIGVVVDIVAEVDVDFDIGIEIMLPLINSRPTPVILLSSCRLVWISILMSMLTLILVLLLINLALKPSYICKGRLRLLFSTALRTSAVLFVYCSALVALRYTWRRLRRDDGVKIRPDTEKT